MHRWSVLNSQYLVDRAWMKLREDHVRLPNGHEIEEFHVVEYPNWAAVVCLDTEGHLVLVEQYRHGISRLSLELPAGVIEPEEAPHDGARRELLEETGYVSDDWTFLGRCATDPSNHSNYAYLYVARDAAPAAEQALDHEEVIRVHRMPIDDLNRALDAGDIVHGIHLTALLWASRRGLLV
ncbi:MAG: NUDIX hydrolase [Rhodothermales bacterium]|nr:NUDIX hydrolase [Rhodothermales bacterium]